MYARSCPGATLRLDDAICRSGMARQSVHRPDRPPYQLAAAIGTSPFEHTFRAIAAKRAFEGADPGVRRVGRQIPVAAFAIGSQFQHRRAT